jgi:hypothetical protein
MISRHYVQSVVLIFAVLLLMSGQINGQDAVVGTLCAETTDGIRVTVKSARRQFMPEQDVEIQFEIANLSSRPFYLVRKTSPEFFVEPEHFVIEVPQPLPIQHGDFDYKFFLVLAGKTFKGTISVPAKKVASGYLWNFDVGFGFVFDVRGMYPAPKGITDPAVLRSLLNDRIITVLLRGLTIKINHS